MAELGHRVMLTTYQFSIARFVPDIARDEAANLGVIVVDDAAGVAESAFLPSIRGKVLALAPGFNVDELTKSIRQLRDQATGAYQASHSYPDDARVRSSAQLRTLAGAMKNQLQLSEPRPYRAQSLRAATEELFQELVQPVRAAPTEAVAKDEPMSLERLRALIWQTIRAWGEPERERPAGQLPPEPGMVQIAQGGLGQGTKAQHYADFWFQVGEPVAALVAIPADPSEHHVAWARRDAMPTIVADFRRVNPHFQAVAVLPPNGRRMTPFETETRALLGDMDGVLVAHADELEQIRPQIIPQLASSDSPEQSRLPKPRPPR